MCMSLRDISKALTPPTCLLAPALERSGAYCGSTVSPTAREVAGRKTPSARLDFIPGSDYLRFLFWGGVCLLAHQKSRADCCVV